MRTALLLAIAGAAMLGAAKAPPVKAPGAKGRFNAIYCVREPNHGLRYLVAKEEPDGRLAFGVDHWLPNGALTGAQGIAEREGDHWTYTAPPDEDSRADDQDACTIRIWRDGRGGARVEADKVARCRGGYNEELGTLSFPRSAYYSPVTHELDFLEGVKDAPGFEEQPDLCGKL